MEEQTKEADGSWPSLSEDIIFFEIFSRLPVKSLYKLRCVSKLSHSLTSIPRFLKTYSSQSPERCLLSFYSPRNRYNFYVVNPESMEISEAKKLKCFDNSTYNTYGKSANGLLCVARANTTVICNVGTNEEIKLPLVKKYSKKSLHFVHFCHDPGTDKYKVLRFTSVGYYFDPKETTYEIFTLGVDRNWRELQEENLFQAGESSRVCINGVLYCSNFLTRGKGEDENGVIAAFHVGSERFEKIPYPEGLFPINSNWYFLVEVKEQRLAVIAAEHYPYSFLLKLWIYDNNPFDSNPWKEQRISLPMLWIEVASVSDRYCFCSNREGEIVMAAYCEIVCWIFCYNMETEIWRRIEVPGLEDVVAYGNFLVEDYVENPTSLRAICNVEY